MSKILGIATFGSFSARKTRLSLGASALCLLFLAGCPEDDLSVGAVRDGAVSSSSGGTGGATTVAGTGGAGGVLSGTGGTTAPVPNPPVSPPPSPVPEPSKDASAMDSRSDGTLAPPVPSDASTPKKMCGGIAGAKCTATEYCKYPSGEQACFTSDLAGECLPQADACAAAKPVCGCDGKTYANECQAGLMFRILRSEGACAPAPLPGPNGPATPNPGPTPGAQCAGIAGLPCPSDQFCKYRTLPDEQICFVSDLDGTCTQRAGNCTAAAPVCGCDGKTYANECAASLAGMKKAKDGACQK